MDAPSFKMDPKKRTFILLWIVVIPFLRAAHGFADLIHEFAEEKITLSLVHFDSTTMMTTKRCSMFLKSLTLKILTWRARRVHLPCVEAISI